MSTGAKHSTAERVAEPIRREVPWRDDIVPRSGGGWKRTVVLASLLALFFVLESLLPLRTTVQIGADEGFNLAKATLCLKGYKFYTDIWSDQPPLHTFLITQTLRHVSGSVLGPRLITVAFASVLLACVFIIGLRCSGLLAAAIATALLVASPGFLELSSSCMLEIPGLTPGVAALCILLTGSGSSTVRPVAAGALFGAAFLIKPNSLPLLPLALLAVPRGQRTASAGANSKPRSRWANCQIGAGTAPSPSRGTGLSLSQLHSPRHGDGAVPAPMRNSVSFGLIAHWSEGTRNSLTLFLFSVALTYTVLGCLVARGAYFSHFQQSWASHVAPARSFEYGSASDYPFDWSILLKNWDATLPAAFGLCILVWRPLRTHWFRPRPVFDCGRGTLDWLLPVSWLALSLTIFAIHRPWWPYYYIHIAVPLCMCAGIGLEQVCRRVRAHRSLALVLLLAIYAAGAAPWMGERLRLQITGIRNAPQLYYALVLEEIGRLKPFTKWMYASEPIYSFHAGIPMPPDLAVLSLKRFWSGDMTNERVAAEMREYKPGMVLVANDTRELPFSELLRAEYRLIYQDAAHNLYAHRDVLARVAVGR